MTLEDPLIAHDLEDPLPSLDQDGSRNLPNSVSLKQKVLKLKPYFSRLIESIRLFHYILSVIVIAGFYTNLLGIVHLWGQLIQVKLGIQPQGNDVFNLILLGYLLCVVLFLGIACFIIMVVFLLENLVLEKLLDGDEEDIEIEAPTWFRGFHTGAACCLFSFLAATMGWLTNNYLEVGFSKHLDILLLLVYASPYCFGLVLSIVLALLFFFVTLANILNVSISHIQNPGRPDPVSVATTLNASPRERKVKISKVFKTNRRAIRISLLFPNYI